MKNAAGEDNPEHRKGIAERISSSMDHAMGNEKKKASERFHAIVEMRANSFPSPSISVLRRFPCSRDKFDC